MQRLLHKWNGAKEYLPEPVIMNNGNSVGIIHFGTSVAAVHEAIDLFTADSTGVDSLQLLAVPFHDSVAEFIEQHESVFVVEQNRDAQMRTVLVTELEIDPAQLQPVLYYDGSPLTADTVYTKIKQMLGHDVNAKSDSVAGD